MVENKFKIQEETLPDEQQVLEVPKKSSSTAIKNIMSGNFLSKESVVHYLPYIFFMTFLGICYIANGYQAEKIIRKIYNTTSELKEMRSEYITTKSELMYLSKQSQVANATAELGLKELTSPPKKIVVTKEELAQYQND